MVNKKYINVHTHLRPYPGEPAIQSLYRNFEQARDGALYSIGLHPWHITAATWKEEFEKIKQFSRQPNVLAIGECGLDKVTTTAFDLQQEVFLQQVQWAAQVQKPLIIHCVRAYDEVLQLLKIQQPGVPVIFHGFNKNVQLARQVIHAGHYLSFGAALQKETVQDTIKQLPVGNLFLETDDSDLSIQEIYQLAAKALSISEESLSLQLQKNGARVFGTDLFK